MLNRSVLNRISAHHSHGGIEQELKGQVTGAGEIYPVKCDLAQEAEIMNMFDAVKQKWGGVDVCVNNAGMNVGSRLCGQQVYFSQL
jgi:NAD(P)-dependent dehydrogenase (short-subunit alcohol dehydrogenase family)